MTVSLLSRPIRGLLLIAALVIAPMSGVVAGSSPVAASSPAAARASSWLAGLVGPDGGVENPYAPGSASTGWTVNVALSLAATGTEPETLDAAMGYIAGHVDDYVVRAGIDNAGALGYLILLVVATDGDPASFGIPSTDLVARLSATFATTEPGLYGDADLFSAGTNQALALLALTAAAQPVPSEALQWLVDQQCGGATTPVDAVGGWQAYRAPMLGGLEECVGPDPGAFAGPDTNTTAFALQALIAVGATDPIPDALEFLRTAQAAAGSYAGGFTSYPSGDPDPNSTAVVLQALTATGEDLGTWARSGQTPLASLEAWVVTEGPDAGALASPFSAGGADPFATYQGVWGLALQPFPFLDTVVPVVPVVPVLPEVPGETVGRSSNPPHRRRPWWWWPRSRGDGVPRPVGRSALVSSRDEIQPFGGHPRERRAPRTVRVVRTAVRGESRPGAPAAVLPPRVSPAGVSGPPTGGAHGLDDADVIVDRLALEDLQDRVYCLQAALEDVARDLEVSREPADVESALEWLVSNATRVGEVWIEPRRPRIVTRYFT